MWILGSLKASLSQLFRLKNWILTTYFEDSMRWKWKMKWKWNSLSCVQLFAIPWTVHGILQARILEWVAFPFSRGSSHPKDRTQVSHIAGRFIDFFNHCIIKKTLNLESLHHSIKIYLENSWNTITRLWLPDVFFPQKMSQEYKEV